MNGIMIGVGLVTLLGFLLVGIPLGKWLALKLLASFSFRSIMLILACVIIGGQEGWGGAVIGIFFGIGLSFLVMIPAELLKDFLVRRGWKSLEEYED